jgi:4-nitrophenyl phosphatase
MIQHVVMDMDGVLYRGDHPLPGAVDTLNALWTRGVRVAFLTNNASRHREELAARLSRLGFACAAGDVWGSAYIAALYLSRHAPDARVFLVGTAGMRREMEEAGIAVVPTHEGATHVVAGLDMTITYEKLSHAHYAICNGAAFIATNLDATFPDGPTTTTPGGGALVAALTTSTGVTPLVMGKPEPAGLSLIAASWGVTADDMAVIGDRLDTDVAAANAFGCLSVLVLTGVSTRAEAEQAVAAEKPGAVLESLVDLPAVLGNHGHENSPPDAPN